MSGIPGPPSSNTSRRPRRRSSLRLSSRSVPPPPCRTVFRASSLAAVTILVWSTRLNPTEMAHSRTTRRTATTSSGDRTAWASSLRTAIPGPRPVDRSADELHALLHVQRGAHSGKRETQLDERDRDRRPHADHDGPRVEDARHRSDVPEHPADERVDDLEGG